MKEVYLLRHAERGDIEALSDRGRLAATDIGKVLPKFVKIVTSDSPRTKLTAKLITGKDSVVDERAGFDKLAADNSEEISKLADEKGITFLEALDEYHDGELLSGIATQARALNDLIDEMLSDLNSGEAGLIITHDLSISPAMVQRGLKPGSVGYLCGYKISNDGSLTTFTAKEVAT